MPQTTPRSDAHPIMSVLQRAAGPVRRAAPTGLVLALIAAVSIGAYASSEPADGTRVPTIEEFNALDQRVTTLEEEVAQLASPSPTPTDPSPTDPSPTDPSPTEPTPTEPTPTEPTPTAPGGCVRPDASNTGHSGPLLPYTGVARVTTAGTVIEDVEITVPLVVAAPDVTLRNVRSTVSIGSTADGTRIVNSTVPHVWSSSASGMVVEGSDLGGAYTHDTVHVTSDAGRYIDGFTLRGNWIHDISVPEDSHYDGIQVRGAANVLVECNTFDLGTFQDTYNAAVYFEDANGGYSGARVVDNWLLGGAFNIMLGAAQDDGVVLTGNRLGGDIRWSLCKADSDASKPALQEDNTVDGQPVTPCP
jgi:hypothetical protein